MNTGPYHYSPAIQQEQDIMTPALKALLDAIGSKEAPKGYGQIYSGAKGVPKDTDVSKMTLNGVLALQQRMLDAKSKSTACGRYQFLRKTLVPTIKQMGLKGTELWDRDLQDRMAIHLMKGRGLEMYTTGRMSREQFANNLAEEWASLPVVSAVKGGTRNVGRGQSYYAGDGLNKAHHKPEAIEALLNALIAPEAPKPPQMPVDAPGIGNAMARRVSGSQPASFTTSSAAPFNQPAVNVFPAPEPTKRGFWAWLFG